MSKKYTLTTEFMDLYVGEECNVRLYRIKALRSFGDVNVGDLGGFIESEANLSHEGNSWVSGKAQVSGDARVYDNAQVYDNAHVSGDACIYDNAQVYGSARVYDNAVVYDNASVYGEAWVYDNAEICDKACAYDNAYVCGEAWVYDKACVGGEAVISGQARLFGNVKIHYMPFVLQGTHYPITITTTYIFVGCKSYATLSDLKKNALNDARAHRLEGFDKEYIKTVVRLRNHLKAQQRKLNCSKNQTNK